MRRTIAVPSGLTIGAAAVLLGTFLPWWRSGTRDRTSYQLLGLIDRLEFAPDGPAATAVRWWPTVPILLVVAVLAVWWQRWLVASLVASIGAVYALTFAIVIRAAPGRALVGTVVTIVGAVVLLVAALSTAWRAAS
ncbi:MAG: hypothetical protein AB7Q42_15625 [Acidimicrobiia bacterium]